MPFLTLLSQYVRGTCQVPLEINARCMRLCLPPQSTERLWNVCWMTSACFSHPVAHCVCLLLKPGPLEAILLLFAWRQSHASCGVFFMSCFWTENTWNRRPWIPHCLTEQRVQLRQSACPLVVCWGVRLHSFHLRSKWLHLQLCVGSRGRGGWDDWPIMHNL